MSRAARESARGRREIARQGSSRLRGSRHGMPVMAVAEVSSRSAHGEILARLHTKSYGVQGRNNGYRVLRSPVIVATTSRSSHSEEGLWHGNRSSRAYPPMGAGYGVPVPHGAAELAASQDLGSGRALIGTAVVMAAPGTQTQASDLGGRSPSSVVQGFGSEVALASPDPGATRRRNHPIDSLTSPGYVPSPSLEERDEITDAAVGPAVLPEIYDRDGRLRMPAPLKGSHEVLVHQNTMADSDGLERITDDGELDRLRANHELVSFPVSRELHVSEDLPMNRRYARPWTVLFAITTAHDFFERFHQPLQVNSAVRTVSYQARLQRVNGNAAAIDGDAASPHLTGQAIDLGKRGMSAAELAWMRGYLLPLMSAGGIDVEEEFQQACFHISVYRRYAASRGPAHEVAQLPGNPIRPQAVRMPDDVADRP